MSENGLAIHEHVLAWADRHRGWLLLGVVLLYAAGFNGQWRIGADSAVHVSIARTLAAGGAFEHPTGRETEVNPGLACLLAGVYRVAGVGERGLFASHVVIWLIGLAGLGLAYSLMRLHTDRPTAVVVTTLLGLSESWMRYGFYLLTDMPFAAGTLLALVGVEVLLRGGLKTDPARPRHIRLVAPGATMVIAGLAVMAAFRNVFATFAAALLLTCFWHAARMAGPRRWWALGGAVLVLAISLAAWQAVVGGSMDQHVLIHTFTRDLSTTLQRAVTQNLPKLMGEVLTEAVIGIDWGYAVGMPLGVFIAVRGLLLARTRTLWGVLVGLFILQWSLFIVTERYVLPILPLLVLAWWRGAVWLTAATGRRWVFIVLMGLFVTSNLVKTSRLIVEQRRVPFMAFFQGGRYEPLLQLSRWLAMNAPAETVVVMDEARTPELTALSGRAAVPFRRLGDFAQGQPPVLMIEPMEERSVRQLQRRGWTPGQVLWTYTDAQSVTWRVRALDRVAVDANPPSPERD